MSRAAKVCPTQGCANIIPNGERLCDDCKAAHGKPAYDANRPTAAKRGYDANWRRIRNMFLLTNPLCADCGTLATEVDHIIPLSDGGTHHRSNLQSKCKRCHSSKTAKFDGGFGNKRQKRSEGEGA